MEHKDQTNLQNRIAVLEKNMGEKELELWRLIRIAPEQWETPGGSIWVTGIAGNKIICYHEQEDRFILAAYKTMGAVELPAAKIAQSDVPDTLLSLLTALRAATG